MCFKLTWAQSSTKKELLIKNGYSADVLLSCFYQKLANFAAEIAVGPESVQYI